MTKKHPKFNNFVEIHKLISYDRDDCINSVGYYAYGHWDAQSFAIAVNKEFDLGVMQSPVWVCEVMQGYVLVKRVNFGLTDHMFFYAGEFIERGHGDSRESFAVTYADICT